MNFSKSKKGRETTNNAPFEAAISAINRYPCPQSIAEIAASNDAILIPLRVKLQPFFDFEFLHI